MSESPSIGVEPVAKRARIDDDPGEHGQEIPMEINDSTILEWLNKDTLYMILDYLRVDDILSTITLSRKWNNEMLEYLKRSRFCFEHYYLPRLHFVPRLLGLVSTTDLPKKRSTPFDMSHGDWKKFLTKIRELGPAIDTIILDCLNASTLDIIAQNCTNLENFMLVGMQEHFAHQPHNSLGQNGKQQCEQLSFTEEVQQCLNDLQLKHVTFIDCKTVTDEYIGEFLKCDSMEELVVSRNPLVEGGCLSYLWQKKEDNLKSLRLVGCRVKWHYLESAADRLTKLQVLDLSNNDLDVMENVHRLLDNTSNLQHLFLNSYPKTESGIGFVQSFRSLRRLKHLSLCWNDNVCDELLEAVAQGCPGLLTLDIENSWFRSGRASVTAGGILALCRALPELTDLGVASNGDVTDSTVAAIVEACPKLESVDLRGCARVAENISVLTALAACVKRPLRLRLARTAANRVQAQVPPGLIFDFVDAPRLFRLV